MFGTYHEMDVFSALAIGLRTRNWTAKCVCVGGGGVGLRGFIYAFTMFQGQEYNN